MLDKVEERLLLILMQGTVAEQLRAAELLISVDAQRAYAAAAR